MAKPNLRSVLIPILSKFENTPDFLVQASRDADRVVLLSVIDQKESVGPFGFTTNEIRVANQLMQQISTFLSVQGKQVESVLEWGGVPQKIVQLAELNRCSHIFLVRQQNEYYKNLVQQVRLSTQIEVEELIVPHETKK
ncbi:MAG: universal stress protein [Candidatus Diapherotrites archaeon]|uniref:Universal stress protein n=1 Tax=Candidatus Iainarchaeum sp. TaxID=3101447 RepID=A0A8T4L4A6_9ARCH|nr:universal stress protein [Candidatus Diapherotrites archaeon]